MLHIILLILKILGIILAVILGVIVLLVCSILFVPIRYEMQAGFPGKVEEAVVKAKFSWLLHLIDGDVCFENKELHWKIRAAWLKFSGEEDEPVNVVADESGEAIKKTAKEVKTHLENEETSLDNQTTETVKKDSEQNLEKDLRNHSQEKEEEKVSIFHRINDKIEAIFEKIKCTFSQIRDKIRSVSELKNRAEQFLTDETHKQAFLKAKKEIKWIIRFVKPKKFHLDLHYGFEDPYITGQILAVLSMIYPFVGDNMSVQPDFEYQVLEGKCYIKGNPRIIFPTVYMIKLILNKHVRKTFIDAKNFKFK